MKAAITVIASAAVLVGGFALQHLLWGSPAWWTYALFWGLVGLLYLAARHALPDAELAEMPEAPWNAPGDPHAHRKWREWVDRRRVPKPFAVIWLLFISWLIGAGLYGAG